MGETPNTAVQNALATRPLPTTIQTLSGETVTRSPEPGEIWVLELENIRLIYIAQQGRHAVSLTIQKSTGKVVTMHLDGWINQECRPMVAAQ